jgi:hypothetical protein
VNHKKIFYYEILIIVIALSAILGIDFKAKLRDHTSLLLPPKDLKYFSLGYQEIIADVLWLRTLQDIDLCGSGSQIDTAPAHAQKGVDLNELIRSKKGEQAAEQSLDHAKCNDGWSARMLDSITELAPKFKMPYLVGGTILSVVVHDDIGATIIFKKGVERFPEDWTMAYRAAYHSMEARHDFKSAAEFLIQAGRHGAPAWVFALAARLQTRTGQAALAKPVLEEAIAADPDSMWAQTLKDRLKEVNQIIEKGE